MTIVVTWISTRCNGLAGQRQPYAQAATWLIDAKPEDVQKAQDFCDREASKMDGTERFVVRQYESKDVDAFNGYLACARATAMDEYNKAKAEAIGSN